MTWTTLFREIFILIIKSNLFTPFLYSISDARQFQDKSASTRNRLLDLLMAAEDAQKSAVTGNTNKEQARAWLRWQKFLKSIELENDDFLEGFPQNQRVRLLSAFAQSVRNGEYSSSSFDSLAASTVNSTVDYVASTFRDNQFPDPRLDDFGKPSRILSKQYKGYKNNEKPAQQQKPYPSVSSIN